MYAWYMPKVSSVSSDHCSYAALRATQSTHFCALRQDEPSTGIGHRHDWEGIVVWIDDPNKSQPVILGVSAS